MTEHLNRTVPPLAVVAPVLTGGGPQGAPRADGGGHHSESDADALVPAGTAHCEAFLKPKLAGMTPARMHGEMAKIMADAKADLLAWVAPAPVGDAQAAEAPTSGKKKHQNR